MRKWIHSAIRQHQKAWKNTEDNSSAWWYNYFHGLENQLQTKSGTPLKRQEDQYEGLQSRDASMDANAESLQQGAILWLHHLKEPWRFGKNDLWTDETKLMEREK